MRNSTILRVVSFGLGMGVLLSCSSGGFEQPPPTQKPATLPQAPEMIPDPVAVVPELTVPPPRNPRRDSLRSQQLVAVARSVRADAKGLEHSAALLREALAADSTNREALWELGWNYQVMTRWDDALDTWDKLASYEPRHVGLQRYVPIVEMRRDDATQRMDGVAPDVEEKPRPGEYFTVGAVGDIQLGTTWPEDAPRIPSDSARSMFTPMAAVLRHPDVTFGNLETVLADSGVSTKCRRGSRNCYAFRAPTAFAKTLRTFGFDILSANNNHASDFGQFGMRSTMDALDAADLRSSGSIAGLASWETRGLKVGLLAFSTGDGPFRVQDIESARHAVLEADRNHDLVFVSFHGGAEGSNATRVPRTNERAYGEDRGDVFRFARTLVDAGADLILGHGPHVLRGMEIYRGRFIAYSLGNFAAWHGFNLRGPLGISTVLHVTLAPNGVVTDATIHPVNLVGPGIPTPDPNRRAISMVRELSELDFGDPLFDTRGRLLNPPLP